MTWRWLPFALLVLAPVLDASEPSDLRIKVPPGTTVSVVQNGETLEISFVPKSPEQAAANAAPKDEVNGNGDHLPNLRLAWQDAAGARVAATPTPAAAAPTTSTATTATSVAENPSPADVLQKEASAINFDRPLSAAPAFVALGVTPETVDTPGSPRQFAASLLNGVDRHGTLQSGLALEVAPYQLFAGRETNLNEYRNSYLTRLLYNTSLSLGTTKASTDDDKAQRLALGLAVTLFDRGDPRLNRAIDDLFETVTGKIRPYIADPDLSDTENAAARKAHYEQFGDPNKAYLEGLEKIRAASWGKTSWNVAWAPTWVSASGKADDLKYEGFTAWSTFAYGFEGQRALKGRAQLLAHARFRDNELVQDADDSTVTFRQDSLLAAARLRWGRPDLNFSFEGAYIRLWDGPHGDRDAWRYGASLEKKIGTNLWLVMSAGESLGEDQQDDELFALGSLRFGAADSPNVTPP